MAPAPQITIRLAVPATAEGYRAPPASPQGLRGGADGRTIGDRIRAIERLRADRSACFRSANTSSSSAAGAG
jgi:hypothetical protein